ncbi:hypothetical protein CKAH01_01245 [Colletotrichum kahawae]|uniref:Uncharacterized protein n=1 Tax=Colletotrichum kahawae TaxID=34407 RepID=A0AAE0D6X6_COLKA|nr:hypothetical protein CKAH01_01245 [Colletotrichum kahawae]
MDDFQCLAASVEAHWFRASDRGRHTGFLAPVPLCWGEDGQADRRRKDQNTPQCSNSSGAGQNTRLLLTHSANISHASFSFPLSLSIPLTLEPTHPERHGGESEGGWIVNFCLYPGIGVFLTARIWDCAWK